MKKIFFVATAFLFLLAYLALQYKNEQNLNKSPANISCDINLNTCALNSVITDINATLSVDPNPLKAMNESLFSFSGLGTLAKPSVRIYGLNMDMGVIKSPLHQANKTYQTKIMLASCTQSQMLYRLDVLDGTNIIASIDFVLKQ